MYNEIERINWHILLLRTSACNLAFLMTSILGWRFGVAKPPKPLIPAACAYLHHIYFWLVLLLSLRLEDT